MSTAKLVLRRHHPVNLPPSQGAAGLQIEAGQRLPFAPGDGRRQSVARAVDQVERGLVRWEQLSPEACHDGQHLVRVVAQLQDVAHLAEQAELAGSPFQLALLRRQLLIDLSQSSLDGLPLKGHLQRRPQRGAGERFGEVAVGLGAKGALERLFIRAAGEKMDRQVVAALSELRRDLDAVGVPLDADVSMRTRSGRCVAASCSASFDERTVAETT